MKDALRALCHAVTDSSFSWALFMCLSFFIFNKHNHAVDPLSAYLANLLTRHSCAPSGVSSIFIDIHRVSRGGDGAHLPFFFLSFFFFVFTFCCSACRRIKLSLRCYQQLSKSIPYSKIYFVCRKHQIGNVVTSTTNSVAIYSYSLQAKCMSIIKFLSLYLGAFQEWITTTWHLWFPRFPTTSLLFNAFA